MKPAEVVDALIKPAASSPEAAKFCIGVDRHSDRAAVLLRIAASQEPGGWWGWGSEQSIVSALIRFEWDEAFRDSLEVEDLRGAVRVLGVGGDDEHAATGLDEAGRSEFGVGDECERAGFTVDRSGQERQRRWIDPGLDQIAEGIVAHHHELGGLVEGGDLLHAQLCGSIGTEGESLKDHGVSGAGGLLGDRLEVGGIKFDPRGSVGTPLRGDGASLQRACDHFELWFHHKVVGGTNDESLRSLGFPKTGTSVHFVSKGGGAKQWQQRCGGESEKSHVHLRLVCQL